MKALVYKGPGQKELEGRPKPTNADSTDALVRITKTTICGTDLHILKGDVSPRMLRAANAWRAASIRHDVRQSPDLDDPVPAVRRHQELRLRTRTRKPRHAGVREQKAGSRRFDRRAGIDSEKRNFYHGY